MADKSKMKCNVVMKSDRAGKKKMVKKVVTIILKAVKRSNLLRLTNKSFRATDVIMVYRKR